MSYTAPSVLEIEMARIARRRRLDFPPPQATGELHLDVVFVGGGQQP